MFDILAPEIRCEVRDKKRLSAPAEQFEEIVLCDQTGEH